MMEEHAKARAKSGGRTASTHTNADRPTRETLEGSDHISESR